MRDALSLLDQVLALTGGEVESQSVRRVLGLVEEERFLELFDIVLGHRHRDVFGFVETLVDDGYDLVEFYHGLVENLRLLLRVRLDGEDAVVDGGGEYRTALEARARDFEPADLVRMLAMAAELESQGSLKRVSQPRVLVELLLLRLSHLDRTIRIEDLIEGLGGAPRPRAEPDRDRVAARPASTPRASSASPPRDRTRTASPVVRDPGAPPPSASPSAESEAAVEPDSSAAPSRSQEPASSSAPVAGDPVAAFDGLLGANRSALSGLRAFLRGARRERVGRRGLRLTVPPGPGLDRLRRPGGTNDLAEALRRQLRYRPRIEVVEGTAAASSSSRAATPGEARRERLRELVEREPLLGRAVEELDLELLD